MNALNEVSKQDIISSNWDGYSQKDRQQSVLEKLEVSCSTGVKLKWCSYFENEKTFWQLLKKLSMKLS